MKSTSFFFVALFFQLIVLNSNSQQTIYDTITHNGIERAYILYVPAIYNINSPTPLVFNFHGYTSNSIQQMVYGDFRSIADTANFIIAHPMGTDDSQGEPHWNVWNSSSVDDIGFTSALLDSISSEYNINPDRIYATGMSNGGYFSFRIACELSDRFTAIASVTGAMAPTTMNNCSPVHPTPIMQIHGTSDATVPYNGGAGWSESIADVLGYWVTYNNCNSSPTQTNLPDINTSDGSTVEHYLYENGLQGSTVEHYKVINGGHTWPGAAFGGPGTNQDMDASKEIWRFFSQYTKSGLTGIETMTSNELLVYPNPASSIIYLSTENTKQNFRIMSLDGVLVEAGITNPTGQISIEHLSSGIYILHTHSGAAKFVKQ